MKRARNNNRTEPCQFCRYPISQRHHALPFSIYGENLCTLQLFANCHELYHIIQKFYLNRLSKDATNKEDFDLLGAFIDEYGSDDVRIKKATHFISGAINIAQRVKP